MIVSVFKIKGKILMKTTILMSSSKIELTYKKIGVGKIYQ